MAGALTILPRQGPVGTLAVAGYSDFSVFPSPPATRLGRRAETAAGAFGGSRIAVENSAPPSRAARLPSRGRAAARPTSRPPIMGDEPP